MNTGYARSWWLSLQDDDGKLPNCWQKCPEGYVQPKNIIQRPMKEMMKAQFEDKRGTEVALAELSLEAEWDY